MSVKRGEATIFSLFLQKNAPVPSSSTKRKADNEYPRISKKPAVTPKPQKIKLPELPPAEEFEQFLLSPQSTFTAPPPPSPSPPPPPPPSSSAAALEASQALFHLHFPQFSPPPPLFPPEEEEDPIISPSTYAYIEERTNSFDPDEDKDNIFNNINLTTEPLPVEIEELLNSLLTDSNIEIAGPLPVTSEDMKKLDYPAMLLDSVSQFYHGNGVTPATTPAATTDLMKKGIVDKERTDAQRVLIDRPTPETLPNLYHQTAVLDDFFEGAGVGFRSSIVHPSVFNVPALDKAEYKTIASSSSSENEMLFFMAILYNELGRIKDPLFLGKASLTPPLSTHESKRLKVGVHKKISFGEDDNGLYFSEIKVKESDNSPPPSDTFRAIIQCLVDDYVADEDAEKKESAASIMRRVTQAFLYPIVTLHKGYSKMTQKAITNLTTYKTKIAESNLLEIFMTEEDWSAKIVEKVGCFQPVSDIGAEYATTPRYSLYIENIHKANAGLFMAAYNAIVTEYIMVNFVSQ